MANLSGYPQTFAGDTTVVDTEVKHPLGTRAVDEDGNEYIYLLGVASTAAGDAVTYDEAYATTRAVSDAVGPVAVAQAATVASTYGWYLIKGTGTVTTAAAVADNKTLSLTATAGAVDDADAAGDAIIGMWSRSSVGTAGSITVQLDYPKVHDVAID